MDKGRMRISDLELEAGVPRTRINYYLRNGLLHSPLKTGQTMSYYDQRHVERLRLLERIKMDYLKESGKYRMPVSLLKARLDEYGLPQEDGSKEERSAREPEHEYSAGRKQVIIDTAAALYTENGYYHTTLRDIARKAGISASSIYLYFPDKRELFAAVIDQTIERLNMEVGEVLARAQDPVHSFTSSLQVYGDYYPRLGEIMFQLRAGVVIGDEWAKGKIKNIYGKMAVILKASYRSAMDLGILREMDDDLLTYFLISVAEALFQRRDLDDKHTPEELLFFFMDVVMNGISNLRQEA